MLPVSGKTLVRHKGLTLEGYALQDGELWKAKDGDLAAVAIVTGQAAQDELRYLKSASMQLWLLGYELTGEPHTPPLAALPSLYCAPRASPAGHMNALPIRPWHSSDSAAC